MRGCFRLRAARASTSRDKTTTLTIPNPAHHATPSICVRLRRAATALLARPIAHLPHTFNQCSGCSLALGLSLYKYLPDAVPRLRTLVSRIPCAFTADSNDNNNDHNTQPENPITVCGSEAQLNLLDVVSSLALRGLHRLGPHRLSRVPGVEEASSPNTAISHVTTESAAHSSTIRRLRDPRARIGSSAVFSATVHCDFPCRRSDDTPWRDIFIADEKRRQLGPRAPTKIPDVQLRCLRYMLKLRQIALGGHSTCWSDRERVHAHGWTRPAHRGAT